MPNISGSTHELIKVARLRRGRSRDIARSFKTLAHTVFKHSENSIPVVIPARNEQDDLPVTLLALSRSRCPVVPIVVDNDSEDSTSELAADMGAIVLAAHNVNKMGATQIGINYALNHFGRDVLFTDADTLMADTWAASYAEHLHQADEGKGASVTGSVIFWHGKSRPADLIGALIALRRDRRQVKSGGLVSPRGCNYGMRFDEAGRIQQLINRLDPKIFIRDDWAIRDALLDEGVSVHKVLDLESIVLTKGDRINSIKDLLLDRFDRRDGVKKRHQTYRAQYGDFHIYGERS